uniref:hypothetical protein n=1 Tax=Mycobacterium marinum TaxID=1781 RepID=UPI003565AC47
MSDDTATDCTYHPRQDVLLDCDDELARADRYPRMWNMSAGMAFFQAVIRPDTPDRPEYVSVPMPSSTTADLETRGARIFAVARWNALWEAAQYRRRFFHDDTDADADGIATLPRDLARIADLGDNNIVFIPRTQTRYYDYAPLFHLLPRATLDRFGLPMLTAGQWPFWAELTNPDPYLPADFSQRLSRAWGATIWRHLMPGSPKIAFTKDDPIRILAHNLDFWVPAVTEAMEDEMRTWPIVDTDGPIGPVRLSNGEILEGVTAGGPEKRKPPSSSSSPSTPPIKPAGCATFSTPCAPTVSTTTSPTGGHTPRRTSNARSTTNAPKSPLPSSNSTTPPRFTVLRPKSSASSHAATS